MTATTQKENDMYHIHELVARTCALEIEAFEVVDDQNNILCECRFRKHAELIVQALNLTKPGDTIAENMRPDM